MLVDSAPIIYVLEGHPRFAARFSPLFQRHAEGRLRLAVTTVTLAEVLTGPLRAGEETLARSFRAVLESWQVVELTGLGLHIRVTRSVCELRSSPIGPESQPLERQLHAGPQRTTGEDVVMDVLDTVLRLAGQA